MLPATQHYINITKINTRSYSEQHNKIKFFDLMKRSSLKENAARVHNVKSYLLTYLGDFATFLVSLLKLQSKVDHVRSIFTLTKILGYIT